MPSAASARSRRAALLARRRHPSRTRCDLSDTSGLVRSSGLSGQVICPPLAQFPTRPSVPVSSAQTGLSTPPVAREESLVNRRKRKLSNLYRRSSVLRVTLGLGVSNKAINFFIGLNNRGNDSVKDCQIS